MAFNVATVRDGIETRLATITGLRTYDTIPDKPESPAAVVTPGEPFVDYHEAMRKGLVEARFDIVLLVARAVGDDRSQTKIDGYLSAGTSQTTSVIDAIEGDVTLGGAVDHCFVAEAGGYGTTNIGGIEYVTARVSVIVRVPRT
jgi:hypothetical protein